MKKIKQILAFIANYIGGFFLGGGYLYMQLSAMQVFKNDYQRAVHSSVGALHIILGAILSIATIGFFVAYLEDKAFKNATIDLISIGVGMVLSLCFYADFFTSTF